LGAEKLTYSVDCAADGLVVARTSAKNAFEGTTKVQELRDLENKGYG